MLDPFEPRAARVPIGVSALVREVAESLARRFSVCSVRGELSGFSRAASGHCYFTLKDADGGGALIRCAMFRRAANLTNFAPADGQLVDLRGRLGVYEARGELQFVVESMQRAGAGALFEQFMRTRLRLEAEGLFDAARKRPLPRHPRRIGIVTSLGGAVLHDVATTFARRAPHVALVVYPSSVQGTAAPASLIAAIETACRHADVDLLIVCRGGGSFEDLWAFNDERLARAIAAASLPVVSAVGHETDTTLADFAADLRVPTPTAAAELVTPATEASREVLALLHERLQRQVHARLDGAAQRLDRLSARLARPGQRLQQQGARLSQLARRLTEAGQRGVRGRVEALDRLDRRLAGAVAARRRSASERLTNLDARLQALDPRRVLARGYAWLEDEAGRPVVTVERLTAGERLSAVLTDGSAKVVVDAVSRAADPR